MAVFNFFRITADFLHLLSHGVLLWRMYDKKNVAGISLKTWEIYAIVFCSRYLDIFTNTFSMYNTIMKLVFLATTAGVIYMILKMYRQTYDAERDNFIIWYLVGPAFGIGLICTFFADSFSIMELLWRFSIVLESVAIIPQIYLLQQSGEVENMTSFYIFCLGLYRGLYIFNWIYRYFTEPGYSQWFVWIFGFIQTALYCDFFYYYIRSRIKGEKLVLPK